MKTTPWSGCWLGACGLTLAVLAGCQTYIPEASVTLPSGRYLEHPPQYIPPSPPFPLSRELASLEAAQAAVAGAAAGVPGAQPPPGVPPQPIPILPPPGN